MFVGRKIASSAYEPLKYSRLRNRQTLRCLLRGQGGLRSKALTTLASTEAVLAEPGNLVKKVEPFQSQGFRFIFGGTPKVLAGSLFRVHQMNLLRSPVSPNHITFQLVPCTRC
jgi:hypothetical protein